MKKYQFNFSSNDEISIIRAIKWVPDGEIKGAIQIVTGVNDHIDRYDEFGRYFSNNGYIVFGNDNLGCGKSESYRGTTRADRKYSSDILIDDIIRCACIMKQEHGFSECIAMGVSLGSELLKVLLSNNIGYYTNVILVGAYTDDKVKLYTEYIRLKGMSCLDGKHSKLSDKIYNRDFDVDKLLLSEEAIGEYVLDTEISLHTAHGLMRETLKCAKEALSDINIINIPKITNFLMICGSEDIYCKSMKNYVHKLATHGIERIDFNIVPGYKHDVIHDDCKKSVFYIIKSWLNKI